MADQMEAQLSSELSDSGVGFFEEATNQKNTLASMAVARVTPNNGRLTLDQEVKKAQTVQFNRHRSALIGLKATAFKSTNLDTQLTMIDQSKPNKHLESSEFDDGSDPSKSSKTVRDAFDSIDDEEDDDSSDVLRELD